MKSIAIRSLNEGYFKEPFAKAGGRVIESIRYTLENPDFAPFLQRVKDAPPDAIFVSIARSGAAMVKRRPM